MAPRSADEGVGPDRSPESLSDAPVPDGVDREAVCRVYEWAEQVKQHELQRAIDRLETRGSVTDEQQRHLEALASSIVAGVLPEPTVGDECELMGEHAAVFVELFESVRDVQERDSGDIDSS